MRARKLRIERDSALNRKRESEDKLQCDVVERRNFEGKRKRKQRSAGPRKSDWRPNMRRACALRRKQQTSPKKKLV
jgi:hypothetical protein